MPTPSAFLTELGKHHRVPVSPEAIQALFARAKGIDRVLDGASKGQPSAIEALKRYGDTAYLFDRLHATGFSAATIDDARHIRDAYSNEAIKTTLQGVEANDVNAVSVVTAWIDDARNIEAGDDVLPPPMEAQMRNNVAPFPPRSDRPSGQAYVAGRATDDRAPSPREAAPSKMRGGNGYTATEPRDPHPVEAQPRQYDDAKAHGGRAALTFAADETKRHVPTVAVEAAAMKDRTRRTYDWDNKIRFQLTMHELQLLTGLLFGYLPNLRLANHDDKWLIVERQDEGNYAGTIKFLMGRGKSSDGGVAHTVQVDSSSLGAIASLCLRQVTAALKLPMGANEAFPILRQVATTYVAAQSRSGQGGGYRRAG